MHHMFHHIPAVAACNWAYPACSCFNASSAGTAQCAKGQTCSSGACSCPAGEVLCGDKCVDVVALVGDINNCGSCGHVCQLVDGAESVTCDQGTCTQHCHKPDHIRQCGGADSPCTNKYTDNNNCGRYICTLARCLTGPAQPWIVTAGRDQWLRTNVPTCTSFSMQVLGARYQSTTVAT